MVTRYTPVKIRSPPIRMNRFRFSSRKVISKMMVTNGSANKNELVIAASTCLRT